MPICRTQALVLLACLLVAAPARPQPALAEVTYRVSFPAPQHHYARVEVGFERLPPGPLEIRMSRTSPGRYALHEFARHVFDVEVSDGAARPLTVTRPDLHQWTVHGHDGTVRLSYKVFGHRVDGTYLGIDASHAHMNLPATLMWARGLEARPARITFEPPDGAAWKPATQLFPTAEPWTFTAPNLQYLLDSPVELSDHAVRRFHVTNPDGRELAILLAVHHEGRDADVDELAALVERLVREQGAVFGEYPVFDTGTYTFLFDVLPRAASDGMEHRNSTVITHAGSLAGQARALLGLVAHEFFHAWNVERIRPRSLEPFDFEAASVPDELWLGEGFTQYYGDLTLARAGLAPAADTMVYLASQVLQVAASPAYRFRSAVDMSRMAAFVDGARFVDPTNFSYSFISYYSFGAALALALDFELRQRSDGRLSLDDYMRAMWRVHGRPGGPAPGIVANPYTMADARARLADITDAAFADTFFDRYIEGREIPDYARLLGLAGLVVRPRHPGGGWTGITADATGRVTAPQGLAAWGSPAFEAGLAHGDVILTIDGGPFSLAAFERQPPGARLTLEVRRPGAERAALVLVVGEDPRMDALPVEATGGTLTDGMRAFREQWLGSKVAP
jgi:predicted metalloprotease with PDZ domain